MKCLVFITFCIWIAVPFPAFSQTGDNAELKNMFTRDQSSRMVAEIDWAQLTKEDSIRRARIYELINTGKIITGQDYYHAAMIFQHGSDTSDFAMAMQYMKKAIERDSTVNKWLLAAATDRYLMNQDKPQIYGTQYTKQWKKGAKWERYKIDSTQVTDKERQYYGVETLAEQRAKLFGMNLRTVSSYYAASKSIGKTIRLINTEKAKGNKAAYSVGEESINTFGFELTTANKTEEALQIFRLNTDLYPQASNTFDSYG